MLRKTTLGLFIAAGLVAGINAASAQTVTCTYQWCVNQVVVTPTDARLEWGEIRMMKKLPDATILWILFGGADDEFRIDSAVITGTNAAGSSVQLPLREISTNRFALDNLNTNDLTYTYELRVYKKNAPSGTAPVIARGSIVNSYN